MNKRIVAVTLVILTIVGIMFAQAPKPKPAARPSSNPNSNTERAVWNAGWEVILGITETDFHTLGFDTQSKEQATQIFTYLAANRPHLTCSKFYKDKDELKRVHVFVEADSSGSSITSQEFVGQLRSRLSAIHDVSLVYSDSDADIIVKTIAFPTLSESGRQIGFTASIVGLTLCTFKSMSGYDKGEITIRELTTHKLLTGPSEEDILSRASSSLDVGDFDDIRKEHANSLKIQNP